MSSSNPCSDHLVYPHTTTPGASSYSLCSVFGVGPRTDYADTHVILPAFNDVAAKYAPQSDTTLERTSILGQRPKTTHIEHVRIHSNATKVVVMSPLKEPSITVPRLNRESHAVMDPFYHHKGAHPSANATRPGRSSASCCSSETRMIARIPSLPDDGSKLGEQKRYLIDHQEDMVKLISVDHNDHDRIITCRGRHSPKASPTVPYSALVDAITAALTNLRLVPARRCGRSFCEWHMSEPRHCFRNARGAPRRSSVPPSTRGCPQKGVFLDKGS